MPQKQVDKEHYNFTTYMTMRRWSSLWYQLKELVELQPASILEIGPGPGVFKSMASQFGLPVDTIDLDIELNPDFVGSATDLPFADNCYDVVCAFQVLEHMPYDIAMQAYEEMVRVCRRNVVISLPDAKPVWNYRIYIPKLGARDYLVPRPMMKKRPHIFDGEHYWELNKKGYELDGVIRDLENFCKLSKTYRVPENPYHRFFVLSK